MMSRQSKVQKKLFYTMFNMDQCICKGYILAKFNQHFNFDFSYNQVKDNYGNKGNVSVPPPVILKMMLIWLGEQQPVKL